MGLTELMIPGSGMIFDNPRSANVANHTIMIGPNTLPTAPVPRLCTMNKHIKMATAIGRTQEAKAGETSSRPSTALNTEIAGVMIPSP